MKKYLIGIYFSVTLASTGYAQLLSTRGTAIVNDKGDTVLLRGMGLGGWMLQEGYMFRVGNLGQQYRIREKITEVVGPVKAKEFYEQWLLQHTTKKDIDSLAAWGFNSIRLPMHYELYTLPVDQEPRAGKHTWLEKGFALTDSLLNWCRSNKIYLILDLHAAPGGQGNDLPISDRNPAKPSLWQSRANQEKMIALWRKLAERYVNDPWMGGYDIINEPNWGFEDSTDKRGTSESKNIPLKQLMVEVTKAIRDVDKKHIIIIEGNGFGNNYRGILPQWDNNMVLSFHKYGNFNTRDAIKSFLTLRDSFRIPIWLGESGENSNTWFTEAIKLVEENGIGWAWWQHKKMGINNPLEIKSPEGYDHLLAYWSGKGPKPDEDFAWKVLQQLLANTRIENNIYHPGVIDAMIRQVRTTDTKPYQQYRLNDKLTIPAVDYDLGRQRFAYYDKDSARYQYTPGVNTDGNRGHTYRNDGVDIQTRTGLPYVFRIEDGEWMQYTIQVNQAAKYWVSFLSASEQPGAVFGLIVNGRNIPTTVAVPVNNDPNDWSSSDSITVELNKGVVSFRVMALSGISRLAAIKFEKLNN